MNEQTSMQGKAVVVTGATSGIGLAVAIALAQAGARVLGIGRSGERATLATQTIQHATPGAFTKFYLGDLARQADVRRLAAEIRRDLAECHLPLDSLVNNAGTFADRYTLTEDGVELTLAVNHIAAFLLTLELLPALQQSSLARLVTISSNSHYGSRLNVHTMNKPPIFHGLLAYQDSKLCNVLFTAEFNRRYGGKQLRAFAVDPGLVNTAIGEKGTSGLIAWFWRQRRKGGTFYPGFHRALLARL
jgi:NAD(P)-dependent dehydrogenase (short-subunit alcohol dehydrogenase family)